MNELAINIQNLKYFKKEEKLQSDEFVKEYVLSNKKIINFMSKTIDDFRNFFRIDKEKFNFSIQEAIVNVIKLLSAQFKDKNIKVELIGEDFNFLGYEHEFQQVILNILNNAKDALLENKVKNSYVKITIDKDKKLIAIKDNAKGIPKEILDRVFDPYFTTKDQGKGTGLGLYISKMIIEDNMKGKLEVRNVQQGAIFTIALI